MAYPVANVPWEYLRECSLVSLQNFELSRLNLAANLKKEITLLLDEWLQETASAMLARWLFEHRSAVRAALEHCDNPPSAAAPQPQLSTEQLLPRMLPAARRRRSSAGR